MAIEIEKKFLINNVKGLPELTNGERIVQGYLCKEPQIRFRIIDRKLIMTIKEQNSNGSRFELESFKEDLSDKEIDRLFQLAIYPVIEKVRFRIPYEELIWEIDIYQGKNKGLITVDVEIPSVDYRIKFPDWVDKKNEITQNPKYFNTNLGVNPFINWD